LREHSCVVYLSSTGPLPWRLRSGSGEVSFAARGRLVAGSGNVLTQATVAGFGIAQTFEYHVAAELSRGELEVVLEELEPAPRIVHALYARQKAGIPKVKVFVAFLGERFSAKPPGPKKRRTTR
jgi:DNA-binding transcriptional LysR family regulator